MSRKGIPHRVRFAVFERDGFQCVYCGQKPPDTVLQLDHRTPVAEGGSDDFHNLCTACVACNLGKAARPEPMWFPDMRDWAIVGCAALYLEGRYPGCLDSNFMFMLALAVRESEDAFRVPDIVVDSASLTEVRMRLAQGWWGGGSPALNDNIDFAHEVIV